MLRLTGYLFTFYNTKKTDERKAQIERINDQVRLLYGPLLAAVTATRSSYAAMVRQHSPDGTREGFVREVRDHPEGEEGRAYRHWMRSVLQPLNEKAADAIVNHLNLLDSPSINPLLLQFVAHVSAYRVILKLWEEGAFNEWSAVSYPDKLPEYVEAEFKKIKRKQAELLGMRERGGSNNNCRGGGDNSQAIPLEKPGMPRAKL